MGQRVMTLQPDHSQNCQKHQLSFAYISVQTQYICLKFKESNIYINVNVLSLILKTLCLVEHVYFHYCSRCFFH